MIRSDNQVANTCMRKLVSQNADCVGAVALIVTRRGSMWQAVKEQTCAHA